MTDRAALLMDLAERCEKAQGADRELDARITCALDGVSFLALETIGRSDAQYPGREVIHADAGTCWADEHKGFLPYTASLDAALSLVPEGLTWTLGQNVHHLHWAASANTLSQDGEPRSLAWGQHSSHPALALCAAALRALASGAPR